MSKLIARFAKDESGATAIEYGLIAGLISVGIITAAIALQGSLSSTFGRISTQLNSAGTPAAGAGAGGGG